VYYHFNVDRGVILCLYVDDILLFRTYLDLINQTKSFLSQNFDMKDLGEADVMLNIKILRGENEISLTQSHYVEKILTRFNMMDCKPAATPYDPNTKLKKNLGHGKDQLRYSQIIGSLIYLASATRPDISYAVCRLSRYTSNPGSDHWIVLERVLKYLKGTKDLGIYYSGHPAVTGGYSDANWISDSDDMKATSGYVFTLAGGAVTWRSFKQTILTRSTAETELVALDSAVVEAEWIQNLLSDLPIVDKPVPPILTYCDNQTILVKVKSRKDNMKSSKHIKR
jgi:hypothetical protein